MIKKNKDKIIKITIFLLVIVGISCACYFIFRATGITNIETLREVIDSCGVWGWVVFLILQVFFTIVLCFAPMGSMTFITLGVLCFGANWKTFLLCFGGVLISSILMDLLGRFGGSKIIVKLVGEKDYKQALKLIQEKGMVYLPVMYLLPVFPDDALCCVAGMTKIKFWYHLIIILLCRGIGVATIVFGVNIIPEEIRNFTSTNLWDYIVVITILAFWVLILLKVARFIDKKLSNKLKNKKKANLLLVRKKGKKTKKGK